MREEDEGEILAFFDNTLFSNLADLVLLLLLLLLLLFVALFPPLPPLYSLLLLRLRGKISIPRTCMIELERAEGDQRDELVKGRKKKRGKER